MRRTFLVLACTMAATGCASQQLGDVAAPVPSAAEAGVVPASPEPGTQPANEQRGLASWYGLAFHGRRTANGERFDMNALTAAHPTLPFGTRVRVSNPRNGRSVEVRINDRGPHVPGRIIDLSHAAARALGLLGWGTTAVVVAPLRAGESLTTR